LLAFPSSIDDVSPAAIDTIADDDLPLVFAADATLLSTLADANEQGTVATVEPSLVADILRAQEKFGDGTCLKVFDMHPIFMCALIAKLLHREVIILTLAQYGHIPSQ
jgi:hypothetical protein